MAMDVVDVYDKQIEDASALARSFFPNLTESELEKHAILDEIDKL